MHDFRVVRNDKLSDDYYVLVLECPQELPEVLPGQFAELRVDHSPATYLRRPFSIYNVDSKANTLSLLIKKVGEGTRALGKLKEGDALNLVYPLGNTFSDPSGDEALLVGGGVGIAPMLLLAKSLSAKGKIVDVLIGGRSRTDILEPHLYEPFARNVYITTDDGSAGEHGMVTGHSIFRKDALNYSMICACGPDPMMKAVAAIAHSKGIPCEVSLENLMACGIGACLCCIVETRHGNKTSCVEGPVFNTSNLTGW